MSQLEYNAVTRVVSGTAADLNDWARQCDEFEKETGIKVDRPGSAKVTQKPDGKYYTLQLPAPKE